MSTDRFLANYFPKDMFYRFNDKIIELNKDHVRSEYTLPEEADFYITLANDSKIIPASVLTEIAIQGGPVVLCKFYIVEKGNDVFSHDVYLLSSKTKFHEYPRAGDKLLVEGSVIRFKPNLLTMRCKVTIRTIDNRNVLEGEFTTKMIESKVNE